MTDAGDTVLDQFLEEALEKVQEACKVTLIKHSSTYVSFSDYSGQDLTTDSGLVFNSRDLSIGRGESVLFLQDFGKFGNIQTISSVDYRTDDDDSWDSQSEGQDDDYTTDRQRNAVIFNFLVEDEGYKNVRINGTYGVLCGNAGNTTREEMPYKYKRLIALLGAYYALAYASGASWDDVKTYSIFELSISLGEFSPNYRSQLEGLASRIKEHLSSYGLSLKSEDAFIGWVDAWPSKLQYKDWGEKRWWKIVNHILQGTAYQSDVSTAVVSLIVYIKNVTKGEEHSGSEAAFSDLVTDSSGNWAVNFDDFTSGWSSGDVIEVSANDEAYGKDLVTVTLSGAGMSGVKIVLQGDIGYYADRVIDELGEVCDYRTVSQTEDNQYFGSVASESTSDTTIKGYLREEGLESPLKEEGRLIEGSGTFVCRVRDQPAKGNLVRVPRTSGRWYRIVDEPRLRRKGGVNTHFVCRVAVSSDA